MMEMIMRGVCMCVMCCLLLDVFGCNIMLFLYVGIKLSVNMNFKLQKSYGVCNFL